MHRKPAWEDIRQAMVEGAPSAAMRDADAFWSDFKGRAVRRVPDGSIAAPASGFGWRLAVAGACLFLVVAGAATLLSRDVGNGGSRVESVDVVVSHGGVLIIEDADRGGTMVWVVDMTRGAGVET
jgi:hypothetical protein